MIKNKGDRKGRPYNDMERCTGVKDKDKGDRKGRPYNDYENS